MEENESELPYVGHGMSTEEYDYLAWSTINPKLFKFEVELFGKKWFDYRNMHPTDATYLFSSSYSNAYRMISAVRYDVQRAPFMKGLSGKTGDVFTEQKQRNVLGLWKARQAADRYCIPYDFYCNSAMRIAEEMSWVHMPRPCQLYGDKILPKIVERWNNELSARVVVAEHDIYKAINYISLIDQNAYYDYLFSIVDMREHKQYLLSDLVYGRKVILECAALGRYGAFLLDMAKEHFFELEDQSVVTI